MKSSYVNKCNCKVLNTLLCICKLKGVKSLVWELARIKWGIKWSCLWYMYSLLCMYRGFAFDCIQKCVYSAGLPPLRVWSSTMSWCLQISRMPTLCTSWTNIQRPIRRAPSWSLPTHASKSPEFWELVSECTQHMQVMIVRHWVHSTHASLPRLRESVSEYTWHMQVNLHRLWESDNECTQHMQNSLSKHKELGSECTHLCRLKVFLEGYMSFRSTNVSDL